MDDSRLILSDYQILHELGTGSYGSAHLALHVPSSTKHVIKRIKISHMTPKEVKNARREVQVLSSLSHPYITQFRGSCEEDGFLLIAMDYCAGGDLHSLITKRNGIFFPEDRVVDWFVQLCLAVKYIHDRKILHRDIKSQNIFLTDDGKVRLGDFGIAKILSSSSELAQTCIGTPYYLSPEMCENKPYNNKSDVWALGCVLYEMVTLNHAFEANNMKALILKIIKGTYPPVSHRYSRDLRLLLSQIFQREPQARPSICAVLRKAFIFKRVSKFISGCEEIELKQSLVRHKYHVPASTNRVLVPKRPSDITEPGAKYGVSLNRKLVHKPPTKSAARAGKQAVPGGKKIPKVASHITEKLRQDSRKRCPSEDILSSKDQHQPEAAMGKRYQRRSKSVPHAFKQNNLKPQHQHHKNKHPSPVKLNLMLDSAGLKRGNLGDKTEKNFGLDSKFDIKEPYQLAISPGWLADEFLTKKVKAAHDKRKHVEAYVSGIETPKEPHVVEGAIAKCVSPCKYGVYDSEDEKFMPSIGPKGSKNHKVYRGRVGEIELPNSKDVKELANQSLKWQGSPQSEDDDDEEALLGVLPEQLREVMHEKMKKLVKERTKKMSRMVSERRQWAYEKEKLCNSSRLRNNKGIITKPNNIPGSSTDGDEVQQELNRPDELHNITTYQDNTVFPNNSYVQESDDLPQEMPASKTRDRNSVSVEDNSTVCDTLRDEVITNGPDKRTLNVGDAQMSSNSKTICNELSRKSEITNFVESIDTGGIVSTDKIPQIQTKEENYLPEIISEKIPQDTYNKDKEHGACENMIKSQNSTPAMRARWGAVRTADLEKSPLETTASEMDTTGSSDCVVVYREAGERKQWGKDCGNVLCVLSEAQLVEENRKVQSEITEVTKSLMNVENLSESFLEKQCTPVMMNSTFTLKDGLKDCKGTSCACHSQKHSENTVQKLSLVVNDTFQIEKSCFEKEMKSIGPPLLNSTFCMMSHCDQAINSGGAYALNSTFNISNKELVVTDTMPQECKGRNTKYTMGTGTVILQESKQSLQDTYTVSSGESDVNVQRQDPSLIMEEEREINNENVIADRVSTKAKSGLLEKLRFHMTPQKYKHQKCDSTFNLLNSPLSSKAKCYQIGTNSEINIPKAISSPALVKKGNIKCGLSGILRRFSTKHITKAPTRSRSEETVEKDLNSCTDSDVIQSDSCFLQQGVECVTVKFVNGTHIENDNQNILEHTNSHENLRNTFSYKTPRISDNSVVLREGTTGIDRDYSTASIRANSCNIASVEMCEKNIKSACNRRNERFVEEETQSGSLPTSIADLTLFDKMSTDSGIDSQKTSGCQTSSTECSNSHFLCSVSSELLNENVSSELPKAHNGDQDCILVSNSSEIISSSGFIESVLEKQDKGLPGFAPKSTSAGTQNYEITKTTLLDGNPKDIFQDISPVSISGIQIKLMNSNQHKDATVQSKQVNDFLDCHQLEPIEHKTLTTARTNGMPSLQAKQNSQPTEIKVTTGDEIPSNHHRQECFSQSSNEHVVIPCNPARARPTVLDIAVKTVDILQASQVSSLRDDTSRERKSDKSRVATGEKMIQQSCAGSHDSTTAATQSTLCENLCTELPGNPINGNLQVKDLFSSSDEESEDLASLKQSVELYYEGKRKEEKKPLPELWHLDRDGGVVPGGGGVYSWIEEQRARLEDELSLNVFKKAYHLLEEAQEHEGCVVGESVSQVENLLGPGQCHLAYDILQLVVAEAVYHN